MASLGRSEAPTQTRHWTDERIALLISNLLRAGVLLSTLLVALGAVLYLSRHGTAAPQYGVFRGEPSDLRTLPGILSDAVTFRGRGLIQLGLLILIGTPVARVALAALAFALEGDFRYVAVSLLVLTVLIFSLSGVAH